VIDSLRRKILKNIISGAGVCLLPTDVFSMDDVASSSREELYYNYIKNMWFENFKCTPQTYLVSRHTNHAEDIQKSKYIELDLQNRNIYFIDGLAVSEYEFALLALKVVS
jgi:hypothetical protein